eukprot:620603-Rhodomonas_salina.1
MLLRTPYDLLAHTSLSSYAHAPAATFSCASSSSTSSCAASSPSSAGSVPSSLRPASSRHNMPRPVRFDERSPQLPASPESRKGNPQRLRESGRGGGACLSKC